MEKNGESLRVEKGGGVEEEKWRKLEVEERREGEWMEKNSESLRLDKGGEWMEKKW